jgi:hypothetical protein
LLSVSFHLKGLLAVKTAEAFAGKASLTRHSRDAERVGNAAKTGNAGGTAKAA